MITSAAITSMVQTALSEDVGDGDITAALIPTDHTSEATIITREPAIICGTAFVDEVFQQLDKNITLTWQVKDGDAVAADQVLCHLNGCTNALLTGERCALNFLQTLSATATQTRHYVDALSGTKTLLLDTRKTIPGLRLAQKYAVKCGGGHNHRVGLYDMFLIKENHITACGTITDAVKAAKTNHPDKTIEVEVETLEQCQEAIQTEADIIMLDNFTQKEIQQAVKTNAGQKKLEISGNIDLNKLTELAELAKTGVDYISAGALTKNIKAIDLSMRVA